MRVFLPIIAMASALLMSCGQATNSADSHTSSIYRDVAEGIFATLLPTSLSGLQSDPNKLSQPRTGKCSLKIVRRANKKRPQFEFTFVRPGRDSAETTVIAGENFSGTLGGTLMNGRLLPPSFEVTLNKEKTSPTGYIVSFLFNEIECKLEQDNKPSAP